MSHTSGTKPVLTTLGAGVLALAVAGLPMAAAGGHTSVPDGVGLRHVMHGNAVDPGGDPADAPENWRRLLDQIDTPSTTTGKVVDECVYDPRHLPHTADAIEGWYRDCRARH